MSDHPAASLGTRCDSNIVTADMTSIDEDDGCTVYSTFIANC
jgi:hypothetical protein